MKHSQLVVVIGLIERDDKLLITRRVDPEHANWHGRWEIPGGKIKAGETPLEAIHREIYEETQLTFHSPQLLGIQTHHWKTSTGVQQTFLIVYHGQAHPGEVILSPDENDAYSWDTVEQILLNPDTLDGTNTILEDLYMHKNKVAIMR